MSTFDISESCQAESHCDAASERVRDESSTLNKRIEFFSENTDWLSENIFNHGDLNILCTHVSTHRSSYKQICTLFLNIIQLLKCLIVQHIP